MKRFTSIGIVVVLVASADTRCGAAVLYSQVTPAEPIGAYSSVDIPSVGQKIADNFVIDAAGPFIIRSLRFIGSYGMRNPPPLTPPLNALPGDSFRVVFLGDIGNGPGMPLESGDFAIGAAIRRTPTGGPLLNGITTPMEFVVDLGNGIELNPLTKYWLSITNNPGAEYGWSWARANGVLDSLVAATFEDIDTGAWTVGSHGGMWFELSDQNIPEPTTYVMLWVAATATGLARVRGIAPDQRILD
jgi:hypothetical protein